MLNGGSDSRAVRPIDDSNPQRKEHAPPRLTVGIALVAIGGLLGWAAASFGAGTPATSSTLAVQAAVPTTVVSRYGDTEPSVMWTAATIVPQAPPGMEYAGISDVAELEGRIYLIVNFREPATNEIASHILQSEDGLEWDSTSLEVEGGIAGYELTTVGNTLLMVGQVGDDLAMWQSVPGRAVGGSSWIRIDLAVPGNLSHSFITTAVNTGGEIVTVLIGELEIWRDILEPYVPVDIDLDDPAVSYHGDQFLYMMDGRDDVRLFADAPKLVVTEDHIWIRFVTADGDEVLQTVEMPPGVYPVATNPTLAEVRVAMAWISKDANDIVPVAGRGALPNGFFLPEPWGDQFVAAAYELSDAFATDEQVKLWISGSGRAWQTATQQPPAECSPFTFATSGNRMHLTSEDGVQCVRDIGTPWEILEEPSANTYVVGGPAGFVGYPDSFEYDSALFSRDGISWTTIEIPGSEPYPTLSILRTQLLALSASRSRPNQPTQIDIWIGEIQ